MIAHGKPWQEHSVDVTLKQRGCAPPPVLAKPQQGVRTIESVPAAARYPAQEASHCDSRPARQDQTGGHVGRCNIYRALRFLLQRHRPWPRSRIDFLHQDDHLAKVCASVLFPVSLRSSKTFGMINGIAEKICGVPNHSELEPDYNWAEGNGNHKSFCPRGSTLEVW